MRNLRNLSAILSFFIFLLLSTGCANEQNNLEFDKNVKIKINKDDNFTNEIILEKEKLDSYAKELEIKKEKLDNREKELNEKEVKLKKDIHLMYIKKRRLEKNLKKSLLKEFYKLNHSYYKKKVFNSLNSIFYTELNKYFKYSKSEISNNYNEEMSSAIKLNEKKIVYKNLIKPFQNEVFAFSQYMNLILYKKLILYETNSYKILFKIISKYPEITLSDIKPASTPFYLDVTNINFNTNLEDKERGTHFVDSALSWIPILGDIKELFGYSIENGENRKAAIEYMNNNLKYINRKFKFELKKHLDREANLISKNIYGSLKINLLKRSYYDY